MKTKTRWSVVLAFVLLVLVCLSAPPTVYFTCVADKETVKCAQDFIRDFYPDALFDMPEHPKSLADNFRFFYDLFRGR